jgi:hypothetical protein
MGGLDGEVTIEGTALVVEDNDVNRMIARSPSIARHAGP